MTVNFKLRRAALYKLRRYLLDLSQPYQGFGFGRSPFDLELERLTVLLREAPGEEGLALHAAGPFSKPGIQSAAEVFGIPEFREMPIDIAHLSIGTVAPQNFGMPQFHGTYGELRRRVRPIHSGLSVGREGESLKGTIGPILFDPASRRAFVVSNNHVLASSSGSLAGVMVPPQPAARGDDVVQPSIGEPAAAGTDADEFGELFDFVPLAYVSGNGDSLDTVNEMDIAIAEVVEPEHRLTAQIPYLGPAGQPAPATGVISALEAGEIVMKVGRTTGLTYGRVIQGGAMLRLPYPQGPAILTGQIITTHMSASGDSGSLVLNDRREAVGVLVGGSDYISIVTPMPRVLRVLRDRTGFDLQLWTGQPLGN